jgi:hypothetical protein
MRQNGGALNHTGSRIGCLARRPGSFYGSCFGTEERGLNRFVTDSQLNTKSPCSGVRAAIPQKQLRV